MVNFVEGDMVFQGDKLIGYANRSVGLANGLQEFTVAWVEPCYSKFEPESFPPSKKAWLRCIFNRGGVRLWEITGDDYNPELLRSYIIPVRKQNGRY